VRGKAAARILGIGWLLETKDFESCTPQFTKSHWAFFVSDLGVHIGDSPTNCSTGKLYDDVEVSVSN
jgi:hypothetical protein